MKLSNIQSNITSSKIVISAIVSDKNNYQNKIYFSFPKKYKDYIYKDGSAFLALFLIPAMKKGEDLYIDGIVSQKLFKSIIKIINILSNWNLGLKKINVTVQSIKKDKRNKRDIGLFFSAGVDSFYTLLKKNKARNKHINYIIFISGYDIRIEDKKSYLSAIKNIRKIAQFEKVHLIEVETNAREFLDQAVEWDYGHGAVMASVALLLRGKLSKVYFSSGMPTAFLRPYGTHPALDPLWSTENLQFKHDGFEADRLEKIRRYISKSDIALDSLRVCWRNNKSQYNCCECEKCLRTMLGLYNTGVLHKAKTFPKPINPKVLSNLYLYKNQKRYFRENLDALIKTNKSSTLIRAIENCLNKNENPSLIRKFLFELRHKIGSLDSKYYSGKMFYFLSKKGLI